MSTVTIEGQLEVDPERGVLYFHTDKGITALRICGLKTPLAGGFDDRTQIDLTLNPNQSCAMVSRIN